MEVYIPKKSLIYKSLIIPMSAGDCQGIYAAIDEILFYSKHPLCVVFFDLINFHHQNKKNGM